MELNIEQQEYVSSLSNEAGMRIMIHPRGTYPFPEDQGFSIPPGYKTSVGLKKVSISFPSINDLLKSVDDLGREMKLLNRQSM